MLTYLQKVESGFQKPLGIRFFSYLSFKDAGLQALYLSSTLPHEGPPWRFVSR